MASGSSYVSIPLFFPEVTSLMEDEGEKQPFQFAQNRPWFRCLKSTARHTTGQTIFVVCAMCARQARSPDFNTTRFLRLYRHCLSPLSRQPVLGAPCDHDGFTSSAVPLLARLRAEHCFSVFHHLPFTCHHCRLCSDDRARLYFPPWWTSLEVVYPFSAFLVLLHRSLRWPVSPRTLMRCFAVWRRTSCSPHLLACVCACGSDICKEKKATALATAPRGAPPLFGRVVRIDRRRLAFLLAEV